MSYNPISAGESVEGGFSPPLEVATWTATTEVSPHGPLHLLVNGERGATEFHKIIFTEGVL
jgi:hypothetical protein